MGTKGKMDNAAKQWPDNICSGPIRYEESSNVCGFSLCDADHGIPTIGHVSPTDRPVLRGTHGVSVFNYPGQTEEIARRLVACWNAFVGYSLDEVFEAADRLRK